MTHGAKTERIIIYIR